MTYTSESNNKNNAANNVTLIQDLVKRIENLESRDLN